MPTETDPPSPNGFPIAITHSPILLFSELPNLTNGRSVFVLILSNARSVLSSTPITFALKDLESLSFTSISCASSIT